MCFFVRCLFCELFKFPYIGVISFLDFALPSFAVHWFYGFRIPQSLYFAMLMFSADLGFANVLFCDCRILRVRLLSICSFGDLLDLDLC